MINIVIFIIALILWVIIYISKPYCYTETKFWTIFWVSLFSIIGGMVGWFGSQSVIYLCGGHTFIQ